ncbi:hypothetical protein [Acanthopleuribacter pedis]|uniref:ABC transmembrane type-1 domain-containing protein n=1 Tax=Acanthopleuribacter pedis TaxID=442870 RepID=A0A8J7U662_9BACT|nr:hypothetical protein [Acanthopleuribacter pedis]MBO1321569.1 hypothetical protein [Acanthopleuribacter pedis]
MNNPRRDPSFWAFALFVLVAVLPIAVGLVYAAAYSFGTVGLLRQGFTFDFWTATLTRSEIWFSLLNSAYVATLTLALTWMVALPVSLSLRRPLEQGALGTAVYLPLALPMTVAAFVVFQMFTGSGLLARPFAALGLIDSPQAFMPLIHDPASIGVIVAFLLITIPYFSLLLRWFYRAEAVEELCRLTLTLGGTRRDCWRRVAWPILWQRGQVHTMLWWISVFGAYEIPLLLGKQSPQMVSVLTMRKFQMFDLQQKPVAFIAALIYSVLVAAVLTLVFRRAGKQGRLGV